MRTLEFGFGAIPKGVGEVFNPYDGSVAGRDGVQRDPLNT